MGSLKIKKKKRIVPKNAFTQSESSIENEIDRALIMVGKGRIAEAEGTVFRLLERHPESAGVHYAMGVICAMKSEYELAIECFENATALNANFVEAWFNKGAVHQKNLDLNEMIEAFQKVVELGDPQEDYVHQAKNFLTDVDLKIRNDKGMSLDRYMDGWYKFNKAFDAMEKEEWETAIQGFQSVLAIDDKHVSSYGNMGLCYGRLGHKQEALAAIDKALELDPKYQPAILNRGKIAALNEGEKLDSSAKMYVVDSSKDARLRGKSS